jgi:cytidyltransferase-like protein
MQLISIGIRDLILMWTKNIHVQSSLERKDGQFAMFVGRWQPLHKGHQELFKQAMDEGKNVLICIRDIKPDEKNPFTAEEVKENITNFYSQEYIDGKVRVMIIPDICSIEFGRGVGYDIIERVPPQEIGEISATKIREEMKQNGQL